MNHQGVMSSGNEFGWCILPDTCMCTMRIFISAWRWLQRFLNKSTSWLEKSSERFGTTDNQVVNYNEQSSNIYIRDHFSDFCFEIWWENVFMCLSVFTILPVHGNVFSCLFYSKWYMLGRHIELMQFEQHSNIVFCVRPFFGPEWILRVIPHRVEKPLLHVHAYVHWCQLQNCVCIE